jgi:hypothetical protein
VHYERLLSAYVTTYIEIYVVAMVLENQEIEYKLSDVKFFLRAHLMCVRIEGAQLCPDSQVFSVYASSITVVRDFWNKGSEASRSSGTQM